MSARKVTPPTRNLMDDPAYSTCIANLRAAGYAILSPDEMRGIRDEALEEAAAAADKYCTNENAKSSLHPAIAWSDEEKQWWQCGQLDGASAVAAAIRSLKGGRDAQ